MSFQAVCWAIKQKTGSSSGKATLWSIANYANEHGTAWPGLATIAEDSEQSTDTVKRRIDDLCAIGLLRCIRMRRSGRNAENFFLLQCSPYFSSDVGEIKWLMPSGYVCPGITSPQIADSHDTANCGLDDTANESANGDPHIIESLEPSSSSSSSAREVAGYSDQSSKLAREIEEIAKVDPTKHARWFQAGPAVVVQRFLDAGYLPWHLLEGVRRGMATRSEPPRDINYFKPLWQKVRGEAETPVPQPEKAQHVIQTPASRFNSPHSLSAAADRAIERIAKEGEAERCVPLRQAVGWLLPDK